MKCLANLDELRLTVVVIGRQVSGHGVTRFEFNLDEADEVDVFFVKNEGAWPECRVIDEGKGKDRNVENEKEEMFKKNVKKKEKKRY